MESRSLCLSILTYGSRVTRNHTRCTGRSLRRYRNSWRSRPGSNRPHSRDRGAASPDAYGTNQCERWACLKAAHHRQYVSCRRPSVTPPTHREAAPHFWHEARFSVRTTQGLDLQLIRGRYGNRTRQGLSVLPKGAFKEALTRRAHGVTDGTRTRNELDHNQSPYHLATATVPLGGVEPRTSWFRKPAARSTGRGVVPCPGLSPGSIRVLPCRSVYLTGGRQHGCRVEGLTLLGADGGT